MNDPRHEAEDEFDNCADVPTAELKEDFDKWSERLSRSIAAGDPPFVIEDAKYWIRFYERLLELRESH